MKQKRYSNEQIVYALKRVDGGEKAAEVCREMGISEATFYYWRKRYAGMGVSELGRLKQLEGGKQSLEEARGRSGLGQAHPTGGALKKSLKPTRKRELVEWSREAFRISKQRACGLMILERSSYYYRARPRDHRALLIHLKELAAVRVRFGCRRLTILLRREGWAVNAKRVYRLYLQENLGVRTKARRKRAAQLRVPLEGAFGVNQRWSMDFMADRLVDGRTFRILTVVDQFSRECPLLQAGPSLTGCNVGECLDRLASERGLPEAITIDNGSEFCSRALDTWAYQRDVKLDFIPPRQAGGKRVYRKLQRQVAR